MADGAAHSNSHGTSPSRVRPHAQSKYATNRESPPYTRQRVWCVALDSPLVQTSCTQRPRTRLPVKGKHTRHNKIFGDIDSRDVRQKYGARGRRWESERAEEVCKLSAEATTMRIVEVLGPVLRGLAECHARGTCPSVCILCYHVVLRRDIWMSG
jgi:hypothetical protein